MSARPAFSEAYAAAFAAHVAEPGEAGLHAAYTLGRDAVAQGVSVLELAKVHHDVLRAALADAEEAEIGRTAAASADFFLESVSSFEMVDRGYREAHEIALVERRQAALLRQLSNFLADVSLLLDATDSLEEVVQLVCEQTLELIEAACCVVELEGRRTLRAVCVDPSARAVGAPDSLDVLSAEIRPRRGAVAFTRKQLEDRSMGPFSQGERPLRGWLAAPLAGLDGRRFGAIHLFDKLDGEFTRTDEALLVQLAQMASAAVERVQLYLGEGLGAPAPRD